MLDCSHMQSNWIIPYVVAAEGLVSIAWLCNSKAIFALDAIILATFPNALVRVLPGCPLTRILLPFRCVMFPLVLIDFSTGKWLVK